ncbi:MAG: ferrous iron transport protein B [Planctomycetaceae bacterium]|nr:ferrous iron transport protein B [Planctomycetaceae bacterium]
MSTTLPEMKTQTRPLTVALIGNPNTGKSTLFNALAGMNTRIGNFPGVTVEKKVGRVTWEGQSISLIDLPGTYSLSPRSLDEMVSVDVLLGRQMDVGRPDAVVCIVDAANLERNLYLVSQVLDLGDPVVLVLNMSDVAASKGITIETETLSQKLGIPVVKTEAHRRQGLTELRQAILATTKREPKDLEVFPEEFVAEREQLISWLKEREIPPPPNYLVDRLLLDVGGQVEEEFAIRTSPDLLDYLKTARQRLADAGHRVPAIEARRRYAWVRETLEGVVTHPTERPTTASDKIDRVLTHRVFGFVVFCAMMFIVFQAIYQWAGPFMGYIEAVQEWVAGLVQGSMAPGPFHSLLIDGVIAGVGGVLVFLPQIVFLFFFIALLEDCGYMARAAFLMDKLMTKIGLSGKSFVPLMSSFACAIPGVMATRVIENRRDRMVTMLVAPLMSCSARLPVYLILIAAFIPSTTYLGGAVGLQGLVLFAMYSVGAVVAIPVAWLLTKTFFKGETPPFVMELPSYKWPSPRIVLGRVYDRGKAFVTRAGTLIFAATVIVWALGYFPADHTEEHAKQKQVEQLVSEADAELGSLEETNETIVQRKELLGVMAALLDEDLSSESREEAVAKAEELEIDPNQSRESLQKEQADLQAETTELEQKAAPYNDPLEGLDDELRIIGRDNLEASYLGQMGHAIEPIVKPLGWDWKIGVGAIASFPAREVIIATLGTIYSLGSDVETDDPDPGLMEEMKASVWKEGDLQGEKVYNVPVALSIMVFFALCAQCGATLMTIQRETNSWRWPIFTFTYMTALAYVAALITYQVGMMF